MDNDDAATEAKRYRERAEALRATGLSNSHPDNRWILLGGADAFDRLADFLEQKDRTPTRDAIHAPSPAEKKRTPREETASEPCARDQAPPSLARA